MRKLILLLLLIPLNLFAQNEPVNEDDLFSGSDTVVENKTQETTLTDSINMRSVAISGEITSALSYSKFDESQQSDIMDQTSVRPYIVGDLYFDARLPGGYKGFGSFELKHDSSIDEEATGEKQTTYATNELFVDFNFSRYVYFRAGKQILQWGPCYLWNPTDMMNIEDKTFRTKIEGREGTSGIKAHIPFGTVVNIYGWADMNQVNEGSDIAGAGKFEFLVKNTEMAFSIWGKQKFNTVYGYDFSSRLLGIDIKGEASYSRGSNTEKAVNENGMLTAEKDEESDICKVSINLGRDFDFGEKNDNLNISIEMFYNGDGYSENPLEDDNTYLYDEPVEFVKDGVTYTLPGGDMKTYLYGNGLYRPNYLSKYYAAFFITVKEFITSDFTLMLNGISNIQQKSYGLTSGLTYTNINDFTASIIGNAYLGDENGEYRAAGINYDILITAGILF